MLMNSTVQLSFSYSHGETQLMVALYGPSELRGFKQDPARAVIELAIKDTTCKDGSLSVGDGKIGAYNLESLRAELKCILEQVIHLGSYPRTVFSFQIFLVKKENDSQIFAACANALLAVLNQAGIKMKAAPTTALTVGVKLSDMTDDEDINIEIEENPKSLSHESSSGFTLIDLVLHHHKEVLYMKTSNEAFDLTSTLLGNEKSLTLFEKLIEKRSQEIFEVITLPL